MGMPELEEDFWNTVRPNLQKLEDIREWWRVANGPVTPVIEDADFAAAAAALLPPPRGMKPPSRTGATP